MSKAPDELAETKKLMDGSRVDEAKAA